MLVIVFLIPFVIYLISRLTCGISRGTTCVAGKTVLITGANSGLGYEVALNLAARGCRIIMADVADMEESKKKIIKETNNTNIVTKHIDLSSLKSVREFAKDINETEKELHFLINNGGIPMSSELHTKDGFHPVIQINYLSHFLLTHLLIDLLKKSAPARIIFTSSLLAFGNILTSLNGSHKVLGIFETAYANSKMAMIIASDIFAKKLRNFGITSNCIHPGLVKTPLYKNEALNALNVMNRWIFLFSLPIYAKDPWEGSQSIVNCVISKELDGESGGFYLDCRKFVKPIPAYCANFCAKIWEESVKLVELKKEELLI